MECNWPRCLADHQHESSVEDRLEYPGRPGPKLVAKLEEAERLASLVDTAELAIRGLAAARAKLEVAEKMATYLRRMLGPGGVQELLLIEVLAAWDAAEEGKP